MIAHEYIRINQEANFITELTSRMDLKSVITLTTRIRSRDSKSPHFTLVHTPYTSYPHLNDPSRALCFYFNLSTKAKVPGDVFSHHDKDLPRTLYWDYRLIRDPPTAVRSH